MKLPIKLLLIKLLIKLLRPENVDVERDKAACVEVEMDKFQHTEYLNA